MTWYEIAETTFEGLPGLWWATLAPRDYDQTVMVSGTNCEGLTQVIADVRSMVRVGFPARVYRPQVVDPCRDASARLMADSPRMLRRLAQVLDMLDMYQRGKQIPAEVAAALRDVIEPLVRSHVRAPDGMGAPTLPFKPNTAMRRVKADAKVKKLLRPDSAGEDRGRGKGERD